MGKSCSLYGKPLPEGLLLIHNFHFRSVYGAYVCDYPIFCITKHSQKMQANLHHGIGCEDELFVVHGILVELQTEFQRLYGSDSVHEGYRKKEIEFTKLGGVDF